MTSFRYNKVVYSVKKQVSKKTRILTGFAQLSIHLNCASGNPRPYEGEDRARGFPPVWAPKSLM